MKGPCSYLVADLFLVFSWKIDKVVIFGTNQERDGSFVEPSALSVPLFYAIERRLPREVEHEEDCHCVIADQGKHVDELALTAEIPDGEGDFCVAY